MRLTFSFRSLSRCLVTILFVTLVFYPQKAKPDFWSLKGKGQETVKLVRKLPPVATRDGNTVRFEPEIAGASIPPETATILRTKIQTLLLNAKAGGIQLVDGAADTVIKCIVTGYEPKTIHPDQRQVGLNRQQIVTWIGNIEASVQVLDNRGKPIDAANIKYHRENDFVVAEQEESVSSVTDKKTSWRDKLADSMKVGKGGDLGDIAGMAGGGKKMHDALAAKDKSMRQPTDLEWRDFLIEGLAAKVANRIVPVDQEFVAILPVDKEFAQIRELAKGGRWGDVQEQTEKMNALSGANEAYRLYMLGLSYEAIACGEASRPEEAADLLNKASKNYDDAHKLKPNEREILLAQIRVQDSLDHYLEIQHYLQTRQATAKTISPKQPQTRDENAADNAAVIEMAKANMAESVMITFVQTAPDPNFDTSGKGLLQLAKARVPASVIQAVQKRMAGRPGTQPAVKRSAPVSHQ
jgi:hypothetical protein